MSEASLKADAAARQEATDPAQSVLLQAPAGSGKTAVLTRRFLKLLCTVEDPGEILAITFTRKAAAEMRARITRALRGQIAPQDPGRAELAALAAAALAHGAARGWDLAAEPQRLRIQTIDAFNYWLASELPVAARIGGTLNVIETPGALYARAARRTLLAAEEDPALAQDAQRLFERLDNHWMNLERLIGQMLAQRGHWLTFVAGADPEALCRRVNESLAGLVRARLCALSALLSPALRQRAQRLPGVGELHDGPSALRAWQTLAHLCFIKSGADWRQRIGASLGEGFAHRDTVQALRDLIADLSALPGARAALLELRDLPAAALSDAEAAAIGSLARLLARAAAELHAEFAAAGCVDYTYVTGAARQALTEANEPTEFALRTGFALRHILVDEFQDTSLAQFQLLEMLTVTWEEGDGRTLFLVGDPMQSIYRFRDAEVGLFLKARDQGIGQVRLRALRLTRNFRATPELVDFNNELFAQVFPAADDLRAGAVAYTPSDAARAAASPLAGVAPVSLRLFSQRGAEARALAARVAELRRIDPLGTVAVLVAAHAHAVRLIEALEASGLECLGVDLVPLAERSIVRDLVQLTRAVCDLADRAAWLAVLRAPWCGASLATLTALSSLNDRQLIIEALTDEKRLAGCAPPERARLTRLVGIVNQAIARRGSAASADWLEAAWVALGGPDAYEAAELDDARAFLAALAEREAAFQWRGPDDFAGLLAHLHSERGARGVNPVAVMTIHRAKGLEFDHVFVPALERGHHGAERRLLRWVDLPSESGDSDLFIAPVPAIGAEQARTLDEWLKDLMRRRDANERRRLLYVAATRARRTLWLSAAPPPDGKGAPRVRAHTLLECLWPVLAERFEREPAVAVDEPQREPPQLQRLSAAWQMASLPPALVLEHLPPAHLSDVAPEFSWVGETQRHIGTLVHAWLARLSEAQVLPPAAEVAAQEAAVLAQLARSGVPPRERARAAQLVLTALTQTLSDERGRWLLDPRHRAARAELALTGVSAGRLRNIIIDRSFIDAQGTRWVIDFKTSRHEGGALQGFLDQELERYRGQLATYVQLASALGPEPVRAGLYFPLLQAFREL